MTLFLAKKPLKVKKYILKRVFYTFPHSKTQLDMSCLKINAKSVHPAVHVVGRHHNVPGGVHEEVGELLSILTKDDFSIALTKCGKTAKNAFIETVAEWRNINTIFLSAIKNCLFSSGDLSCWVIQHFCALRDSSRDFYLLFFINQSVVGPCFLHTLNYF